MSEGGNGPGRIVSLPKHMQSLVEQCKDQLSAEQVEKVTSLLGGFQDSFTAPGSKLGVTHVVEHTIDTGFTCPIYQ